MLTEFDHFTHQDDVELHLRGLVCLKCFKTVLGLCILEVVFLRERYKELQGVSGCQEGGLLVTVTDPTIDRIIVGYENSESFAKRSARYCEFRTDWHRAFLNSRCSSNGRYFF